MKRVLSLILLISTLLGTLLYLPVSAEEKSYSGVYLGGDESQYRSGNKHAYTFDFLVSRLGYYSANEALAIDNRTSIEFSDGVMKCKDGQWFSFGSAHCLGDDYGLEKGEMSFDLCLNGGALTVGVRCSKPSSKPEYRGLWVKLENNGKITVNDSANGLSAETNIAETLKTAKKITVKENLGSIEFLCGEKTFLTVKTDGKELSILDSGSNVLAKTENNQLDITGYCTLYAQSMQGYIDNFSYTNVQYDRTVADGAATKIIDYSTWSATDALDRTVADNGTAGDENQQRYVGLFYFLCWVGAGQTVTDNTKIYTEGGIDAVKAHFNNKEAGEAYWAEPYFGYYRNTDAWVYRKHAYMLEAAGVDFIYLDISNKETYINGHTTLFDTWLQIRKEGGQTPQIIFLNGDSSETFESNMKTLFTTVYSDGNWDKYSELFFTWNGKPLILGNISGVSSDLKKKINDKFTVRGCWAWCNKNGYWSWLQEYGQNGDAYKNTSGGFGRDKSGNYESLSITLGHHASTSKGRSYVLGEYPKVKKDMGYSLIETSAKGLCFESQFNAAQYLIEQNVAKDTPFVLMITGWNEWIAGCMYTDGGHMFAGGNYKYYYVDEFNPEYSRDAEPMRNSNGYGFGDNYYYQMIDYIRQYKGISATPAADNQKTVDIYNASSFDSISMKYDDNVGDVEWRNTPSYDLNYRYINNTGRNDLDYAKVSQDGKYLYFLISCADDIIISNTSNWMNLYIDVDGDSTNGWEGFDYVINRARDSYAVSVDKLDANGQAGNVGYAYYAIDGKTMTVMIDKFVIGVEGTLKKMLFKWADNSTDCFDPMEFMDLGDTAPNDRYAYVYLCNECAEYDTSYTMPKFAKTIAAKGTDKRTEKAPESAGDNKIVYKTVDTTFDFNEFKTGTNLSTTRLTEYFEYVGATSSSTVRTEEVDGDIVGKLDGYNDLRTWNNLIGEYSFSVDLGMLKTGNSAVFIRGEMPGTLKKYNPAQSKLAGQDVTNTFPYYEWDWYRENGGTSGASSVGGSGIGIYPMPTGLTILIKKYASDGLTVASSAVNLKYPSGFKFSADDMFNLKCTDDGSTVTVYIDGDLAATVELSGGGTTYETDATGQEYFDTAEVFDATGKKVLTVENTRVNSMGSQIALTTRDQQMRFDNICISYTQEEPSNDCDTVTKLVAADGNPEFVADISLVGEINNDETSDNTVSETEAETEGNINQNTEPMQPGDNFTGCGSVISITVFAVIPGVMILKKRKEK